MAFHQGESEQHGRPLAARWVVLALLGALIPILALGAFAYRAATRSAESLVRSGNASASGLAGALVQAELQGRLMAMQATAAVPRFREAVSQRNEGEVRHFLQAGVQADSLIVRAFVADPEGLLWSDWPVAPESLGKTFSDRDWYRCTLDRGKACISEIYRRNAVPAVLVVSLAVPVSVEDGALLGILVHQIRLEGLTDLLQRVEVGRGGSLMLLDFHGKLVAHPALDLQEGQPSPYRGIALLEGNEGGGDHPVSVAYVDPVSGEPVIASVTPLMLAGRRWTVVAQQPVKRAFADVRRLGLHIGLAALLLSLAGAGAAVFLLRAYRRLQRLNDRLDSVNDRLQDEVRRRRRAEEDLQRVNANLERLVAERTKALQEKQEQLLQAQKMEAIGRLAGGVAHDFNNLLTIITGYSEMLLREAPGGSGSRQQLRQIRRAADRAGSLTRQLLAFSRKQVLQPRVLDPNTVVGEMDAMLRRLIGEDIDLVTKLNPDVYSIKFDPGQIEQIVMNLAVNARDAMPRGGKLTIETDNVELDEDYARTHPDAVPGPHVMIAMTDTGMGMDAETKARIFEPFFTTKEKGKGTGLGLSTVYGIVKQSGGNIWVYSEPGHGTTFKVYLPRAEESSRPVQPQDRKAAVALRGSETILLVEDDEDVRALLRDVLEAGGYRVLATGDAQEAMDLCRRHKGEVDLLLTDVVMPRMGGRELAENIMALQPNIKVVYMSGYTDNAIVHHGVLDPGTAFIEKPIAPNVLLEKIRDFLS